MNKSGTNAEPIPMEKPKVVNELPKEETKEEPEKDKELFSADQKSMIIRLHCVFDAVFKVYKRYHGIIKDQSVKKDGPVKVDTSRRYHRSSVLVGDCTEAELLQDDEYLFCDLCDREYEGDCPEHGPHTIFGDTYAPVAGNEDRAMKTAPGMLQVSDSMMPGAGSGVWTVVGLPGHARLGPFEGDKISKPDPLGLSWEIMKDRKVDHFLSAQSTSRSNWMRYVNFARHESEQNLMAFQYKGHLYYRTVKPVPPEVELFVWYGGEYAEKVGISMESFRRSDTTQTKITGGSHSQRSTRVGSYDPDDLVPVPAPTHASQRVATTSSDDNEKTLLLSSDDELQ